MTQPKANPKPFDRFNKRLFIELLSPYGQVVPNMAVLGGERMIDVFFAPYPGINPDFEELGNLAQMTTEPALLEPCRSSLTDEDVQLCLMKLFMVYADQGRVVSEVPAIAASRLWILAAEVSDRLLNDFGGVIDPTFGDGFYRLVRAFRKTIIPTHAHPP